MKLYFVRHGKTEWNLEGRFQGAGGDSALLPSAKRDLEKLGQTLATIPFDHVYASDLPRALVSAEILMAQHQSPKPIIACPALREWGLGSLEGQKIATIAAVYPQQLAAFRHNLAKFSPQIFGAESVYETTSRTISLIKAQKALRADHILFVGHGANLTASLRSLLGFEPAFLRKEGGLANSSLTILETEDFEHFQVLTWNQVDHLEEVEMVQM